MKRRPRPIGFESGNQRTLVDNRYKIVARAGTNARRARRTSSAERDEAQPGQARLDPTYMLFDLVEDPWETTDISAKHRDTVKKMTATLEAWQASCKASNSGADYR